MSETDDPIELRYTSSRRDLWRWYRMMWRGKLWRFHLLIGLLTFSGTLAWQLRFDGVRSNSVSLPFGSWLIAAAVTASLLLLMVAYPQIRFKPQQRWLRVGSDGIQTTIGRHSGSRSWREVAEVDRFDDGICIGLKNLNSYLLPATAFATAIDRGQFLATARKWWEENR